MKKSIIGVLVAGLALTTGGWAVAHDNQNMLLDVVMKQKVDIQDKSTKIANLDVVIDKKDKVLKADEVVIEKLNNKLQEKSEKIEYVKNRNITLENRLKEAESQLRKKTERLALEKKEKEEAEGVIHTLKAEAIQAKARAESSNITTVSRGTKSKRTISMVATGYIALCNTGCTGITATGIDVRNTPSNQIIAVDPRVVPLGTKVRVNLPDGQSFFATAQDTGGDIKGARIDILKATKGEAVNFGVQNVTITILN